MQAGLLPLSCGAGGSRFLVSFRPRAHQAPFVVSGVPCSGFHAGMSAVGADWNGMGLFPHAADEHGMKRERSRTVHRIGRGARVEGAVRFSGRLEVEGRVDGTIQAEDVRSSAVRVASSGRVDGAIEAAVVQVAGTVNGPIRASKRLYVQAGARLHGDVLYRDLQLEHGALVTGSLKAYDSDEAGLKLVAVGRK